MAMDLSIVKPIGEAFERTKQILFVPFDVGKWFVLGFCAFLAGLGEGGWGWPGGDENGGRGIWHEPGECFDGVDQALGWVREHLSWIILIGSILFVVAVTLTALLAWLRSRGKFMFLDGIAHNRGAVVEPWHRFRQLGNSLFGFSFFLMLLQLMTVALITMIVGMVAWHDIDAGEFGVHAIVALSVGGVLTLLATLVFLTLNLLLDHLVVPAMYARNVVVMEAWSIVRHGLLSAHTGAIILFFVMKFILGIVLTVIAVITTVVTCCCLVALPYIGTVILLPILVFNQCYTLCFLEQFGPGWRFFTVNRDSQTPQDKSIEV